MNSHRHSPGSLPEQPSSLGSVRRGLFLLGTTECLGRGAHVSWARPLCYQISTTFPRRATDPS